MAMDPTQGLAERTERARELVASRSFCGTPAALFVYSDRPGVAGYEVVDGRCSCPDATVGYAARSLRGRCKHAIAAEIVRDQAIVAAANARRRMATIAAVFAS